MWRWKAHPTTLANSFLLLLEKRCQFLWDFIIPSEKSNILTLISQSAICYFSLRLFIIFIFIYLIMMCFVDIPGYILFRVHWFSQTCNFVSWIKCKSFQLILFQFLFLFHFRDPVRVEVVSKSFIYSLKCTSILLTLDRFRYWACNVTHSIPCLLYSTTESTKFWFFCYSCILISIFSTWLCFWLDNKLIL